LSLTQIFGSGESVEQYSSGGPRELVSQGVIGMLRCRQTAAVAHEGLNHGSFVLHLVDALQSQEVIDSWVQAHLVHDGHSLGLGLLVQFGDLVVQIARGDHVGPFCHAIACHHAVETVGQQGNHHIRLATQLLQMTSAFVHIQIDAVHSGILLGQAIGFLLDLRAFIKNFDTVNGINWSA